MPPFPTLGFILATIELERTSKTYCGPRDPVRGKLGIRYQPNKENNSTALGELFCPLKLNVVLEGRAIKYNATARSLHSQREDRVLFRHVFCAHNGSIKLIKGQDVIWPFTMYFPEHADPEPQPQIQTGQQISAPVERLPPSSSATPWAEEAQVRVVYRITAEADMGVLDVRLGQRDATHVVTHVAPEVRGAWPSTTSAASHKFNITNHDLVPEADRPSGFKKLLGKAEAPRFSFVLMCSNVPKHIQLRWGPVLDAFSFDLGITPDWDNSTISEVPYMDIKHIGIRLCGSTGIYTQDEDNPSVKDFTTQGKVAKDFEIQSVIPELPFGGREKGKTSCCLRKRITTAPMANIPPTISTDHLSRQFGLEISVELGIAGQTSRVRMRFGIDLHGQGEVAASDRDYAAIAPPAMDNSNTPAPADGDQEDLPLYGQDTLPTYGQTWEEEAGPSSRPPPAEKGA